MWISIKNQGDADFLMQTFRGFHDSCIKELAIQNREFVDEHLAMHFDNKTFVKVLFQSQFKENSVLEMLFEDVVDFNWVQDEKSSDVTASLIFEAVCLWENDTLYWAENMEWQIDSSNKNDYRWIAAKLCHWRILEAALGSDTILFQPADL
ncbi:hypothetical protein MTX78_11510 [Hymenobacter tibetensis]|uniref:Tim44-like domain-containing protein n=1 Tax=Hymenobacter tibetensis TaxID=497967 RepID=A0ABY4CR57_9BACT|nr:hypothetical protein [Hymenobacter tibetensis]UOG72753.1 hypothetical protein MTX78_11510 [Hymenobacter tibetensis]